MTTMVWMVEGNVLFVVKQQCSRTQDQRQPVFTLQSLLTLTHSRSLSHTAESS